MQSSSTPGQAKMELTQQQMVQQYEAALSVERAKGQAAQQMIKEIIEANINLRAGTLLLNNQLNASSDSIGNLTKDNERLNRVVGAMDRKIAELLAAQQAALQHTTTMDGMNPTPEVANPPGVSEPPTAQDGTFPANNDADSDGA